MALDADRYRLSEAEHQAIFDRRIKPQLFADARPQAMPVAIVFGGQPGAGKSAAVDDALRELESRGGAVAIIGDDLRGYHPHYAPLMERDDKTAAFYTDRDTGRWVEKSIEYAKQQRLNIVIEGTMRDANKVAQTLRSLRGAGYEVEARALAVNERLSWQGVLQRYESQKADRGYGRMTARDSHQAAYNGMPATIERVEQEKLADRITIYRRGAVVIYSNELRDGRWQKPPGARQAVETERARPMTPLELRGYAEGFDELATTMARPERRATPAELGAVDALRLQAHLDLMIALGRGDVSTPAPRHDLNKHQAALYTAAMQSRTGHMAELQKQPAYAGLSADELSKVAFWRGVVMEENKDQPEVVRQEKLARFDEQMHDPARIKQLPDPAIDAGNDKPLDRAQLRDNGGQSL
jgi:predicted ABC-type ATPase